jgi:hypothetical protein
METVSNVKLYSLSLRDARTYVFALLFIVGNIVLPQLCHLFPKGGLIMLPIYFFTLIGAYKYGLKVGLLTALLSPLVNSLLFGMPPMASVPVIIIKGVLLASAAAFVAHKTQKVTLLTLIAVVLLYQVAGCAIEWAIKADFMAAVQDFRIGIPGMLLQIVGGYLLLKYVLKK